MSLFRMPSLGADMEAGTLVEWLKHPGDRVTRGDVVAVVETQKGAIEIEIFEDGVLGKILVQPGAKVPVGAPLAELSGTEAEAAPAALAAGEIPVPLPVAPMQPPAATAVRPPAVEEGRASPAARKLASESGVDLRTVTGSGPDGAIIFVDVERAVKAAAGPKRAAGPDLGEMRKAIAAAMTRSKREIPHYYLSHVLDLRPARRWLDRVNMDRPPAQRILLGALLIKAVARSLVGMPDFNGFYVDGGFRPSARINVGMAVAVRGGGLIAPSVHDADRLTVDETMGKLRDLIARVRSGRLRASELADPTITVSSLGDRGVEALYGVIHPPQVAILGFGAPQIRPWVENDTVVAGLVIHATLAADHRVTDGHRGALFLNAIASALESPETL